MASPDTPMSALPEDDGKLIAGLDKFLPISWTVATDGHGEPTHADLTFGDHATMAMTQAPEDWEVLKAARDRIETLSREIERLKANAHLELYGMQDGSLVRDLRTQLDRVRAETLEKAAKAICPDCEMGIPLNESNIHICPSGNRVPCRAERIRSLTTGSAAGEEK